MIEIGKAIKMARHKKELTQAELGKRLGVSEMLVCKWENNKCQPGAENLLKIMNELDLRKKDFAKKKEKGDNNE